jgi:hypothetical protein
MGKKFEIHTLTTTNVVKFNCNTKLNERENQMGRMYAEGIAETEITLEQQIEWHLVGNHFPPVPKSMVKPCIEAIDACNEEDWDREITMPEGVLYRGLTNAPASAIVEAHHLDTWITNEGDY